MADREDRREGDGSEGREEVNSSNHGTPIKPPTEAPNKGQGAAALPYTLQTSMM